MPRVTFVKKAQKPNSAVSQNDIDRAKLGEEGRASYYWWQFRYGPKQCSKTRPRPSQLTQSAYYGTIYSIQEEMQDAGGYEDASDLESARDGWAEQARELGSECEESLQNMPESLQQAPTGELLEQRVSAMEAWASELECADVAMDDHDAELETVADYLQGKLEELQAIEPDVE